MKYKKNKSGLIEMQGVYFSVKFGLVFIYVLNVYCKKSSSILLRENIFNSLLAFLFWKGKISLLKI